MVNAVPVPNKVPPLGRSYQFNAPALVAAKRVTVPASQRLPGVVAVILGVTFIVAVTAVRGEVHVPDVAST